MAYTLDRLGESPSTRGLVHPRSPTFRWFTPALGLLLTGYLFFDKAFAYLHIPGTPVFVGEIVLAIGVVEAVRARLSWRRVLRALPALKILLAFMAVCCIRLVLDLPTYGLDAVRDSSIWYYGSFAFLVAAAALCDPTFTARLLRWYRRIVPWFLLWAPIAIIVAQIDAFSVITIPDSSTPINAIKVNDIAVHVALAIGFLWLGADRFAGGRSARNSEIVLATIGILALLMSGSQNRGGLVAAGVLLAIVLGYLPAGRQRRIVLSVSGGLMLMVVLILLLNLRLPGERRELSLQQVGANISSIFLGEKNSEELSGTVEWRQGYWEQVVDDLLSSERWLTGVGFGPILPDLYDVDAGVVNPQQPLRNAHNSHLTILARVGFPGLALWVLCWLAWWHHFARWIRRRAGGVRDPGAGLAAILLAAVVAFLVNAFFDPALDGPHAGIWLFTLVGLGVALPSSGRLSAT
jgi:O-antigen ligase